MKEVRYRYIIQFELRNQQEDYLSCYQSIKEIERYFQNSDTEETKETLSKTLSKVKGRFIYETDITHYDKIIEIDEQIRFADVPISEKKGHISDRNKFKKVYLKDFRTLKQTNTLYKPIYYLRITSRDNDNIMNLQFYNIIEILLENDGFENSRILGFYGPMVLEEGRIDDDYYYRLRDYLRRIKQGFNNLYAYKISDKKIRINRIKNNFSNRSYRFLPLFEVDECLLENLRKSFNVERREKKRLYYKKEKTDYELSFLKDATNFEDETVDANRQEMEDWLNNFLEKKIYPLRVRNKMDEKKLADNYNVLAELCQRYKIGLFEVALLTVFLTEKDFGSSEKIEKTFDRVKSLSNGIFQVVENSVYHTSLKKCFFSFRFLETKNFTQIQDSYGIENINQDQRFIEIFITDLNTEENIISNFFNKMKKKNMTLAEGELYKKQAEIEISDFFKDYDYSSNKLENIWEEYRNENSLRCLGLPIFSDTVQIYNGIIKLKSCAATEVKDGKNIYFKNYFNRSKRLNKEELFKEYFPGTQFSILIPISYNWNKVNNANIQLSRTLIENGKSLANFVDYHAKKIDWKRFKEVKFHDKPIDIKNDIENLDSCNKRIENILAEIEVSHDKKQDRINLWKQCIAQCVNLEEKKIEYIDLSCCSENYGEEFCKAFIEYFVVKQRLKYFAFINCNGGFIDVFCKVLSQSYPKLKNNEKQIFLSSQRADVEVLIAGINWIQNAISYSLTNGKANDLNKLLQLRKEKNDYDEKIEVMPFTSLIEVDEKNNKTLFDEYIEKISEKDLLENDTASYKLSKTHMRLGSKVHLDSFYEVSILFQKPQIAKKIAFQIFRKIIDDKNFKGLKGRIKLIFYGYASYSRAILNALIEISEQYNYNATKNMGDSEKKAITSEFVVYQNDIPVQTPTLFNGSAVKIYFSQKEAESSAQQRKKIEKNTYIVQIVPISTTLTTFSKMWNKFQSETENPPKNPNLNFTYFWVRDEELKKNEVTKIEKIFFNEVKDIDEKSIIKSEFFEPNPIIFIKKRVKWRDPLDCEFCFPEKPCDEKVLFETDATSTIPTQQIEPTRLSNKSENKVQKNKEEKNEKRVMELKECTRYGHFYRDTNHYQIYIDTSVYFQKEKTNILEWLKGELDRVKEENKEEEHNKHEDKKMFDNDILNVIVAPQHHTNVEFCQCVNNNYFGGNAEVITIDSRKEYRTNFEVKYSDLKLAFDEHVNNSVKVYFHYVDDSIISGTTYLRLNNLLRTIVPKGNENVILFSKVFVLVNRLSDGSKEGYIKDQSKNFHSFCDLNISSMRTIGDSCTVCKVKQTAKKLYNRSATKEISQYWNKKLYDYEEISFDAELSKYYQEMQEIGYYRMLCSHKAKSLLDKKDKNCKDMKKFYERKILEVFEKIFIVEKKIECQKEGVDSLTEFSPIQIELGKNTLNALKAYLKIFSRPFFSYNNLIKQSFLKLLLNLTDSFLSKRVENEKDSDYKWPDSIISKINSSNTSVDFLEKYLLEGLTDLKSNYLIRRKVFIKIIKYIEKNTNSQEEVDDFYSAYTILIHRLINDSSDESKCLWFEYLLMTGQEYDIKKANIEPYKSKEIAKTMFGEANLNENANSFERFVKFWNNLLVENTRLYFEGINEFKNKMRTSDSSFSFEELYDQIQPQYYMTNFFKFMCIDFGLCPETEGKAPPKKILITIENVLNLYMLLTSIENREERYQHLQEKIKLVVNGNEVYILSRTKDERNRVSYYYIAGESDGSNTSILGEVETLVCREEDHLEIELKKYGYYISPNDEYILVYLCNNHDFLKEESLFDLDGIQKIDPLIIYVKLENSETDLKVLVRRILMFRKLLIKWLEDDFNNNALSNLSKQAWINARLSKEKAGDHISNNDLGVIMNELRVSEKANYKANTEVEVHRIRKWLLLKSYVNMRIARLYRALLSYDCANENKKEKIFKKIYRKIDSDNTNTNRSDPMLKNFGVLFEELNDNESISNYFELIISIVLIHCNFYGEEIKVTNVSLLANAFNHLTCINNGKMGYRTEFIACIILDIIFSCIRESIDWGGLVLIDNQNLDSKIMDSVKDLNLNDTDESYLKHRYMLHTRDDIRFQYWFLKNSEIRKFCELNIETEETTSTETYDYLIFKNKKALKRNDSQDITKLNQELQRSINQDNSKGFSLITIKWYIEKLWIDSNKHQSSNMEQHPNVEFAYVQENNEILFKIKMPILKKLVNERR